MAPDDHKRASLQGDVVSSAAVWPEKLCYAMFWGMRKQLLSDNVMFEGEIGSVCEDPVEKQCAQSLGDFDFGDDVWQNF